MIIIDASVGRSIESVPQIRWSGRGNRHDRTWVEFQGAPYFSRITPGEILMRRLVLPQGRLLESPTWDEFNGKLSWVDVLGLPTHRFVGQAKDAR